MEDHYRRTVALLSQDGGEGPLDGLFGEGKSGTVMIAGDVNFPETEQNYTPQTAPPPPAPPQQNGLRNMLLGVATAGALTAGGFSIANYMKPEPTPPPIQFPDDRDTDTIGILEPDG